MNPPVIKQVSGDTVVLTLNRPEKRNALSPELIDALLQQFAEIRDNRKVRMVLVTGTGKAFCAGADLEYLRKISTFSDNENIQDSQKIARLFHDLYTLPKLTIAAVNGPALAGGLGLALCCDYIFADPENARLGFTEVRIGFVPAIVMNFLIRRVSPACAASLAIGGNILTAREALECGMIHGLFETGELQEKSLDYGNHLLEQNSFTAMMTTKKLLQDLTDLPLKEGIELAGAINASSRKSGDCQKGLAAFLKKKSINWRA